ncbi:Crp/Fnr family transcriptional regulator [Allorhizobium undicola]|uniref:Crp/Fnr family transcriptional regulator n=1 Tax=Allorhizobium undicola TaxID=78527 RepID=UPI003D343BC4
MVDEGKGLLRRVGVFSTLSEEDDLHWSRQCRVSELAAGTIVFDYGGKAENVFFALDGVLRIAVKLNQRKELLLDGVGPCQLVGELSLLDGAPYSARMVADNNLTLVQLPGSVLREMIETRPQVAMAVMVLIVSRFRALQQRMAEMSHLDARMRLYSSLLRLSRPMDEHKERRIIRPALIHAELADYIGASRETVSREMSRLMQDAVIEKAPDAIIIRQPRELARRLSGSVLS